MPSGFLAIGIAQTALQAAKVLLDTASHNIANDATPGYSRQEAVPASLPGDSAAALGTPPGPVLGQGVAVETIRRVRLGYLDGIYRQTQSDVGLHTTRQGLLTAFQSLLGEPGATGLQATANRFFADWQALAQHPEDPASRTTVQQDGETLAAQIRSIWTGLQSIAQQAYTQIGQDVSTVNQDLQELADLNRVIGEAQAVGRQPNDLLDKRDRVLDRLSKLVSIQVQTVSQTVGPSTVTQTRVSMTGPSGSVMLVDGQKAGRLSVSGGATGVSLTATDVAGTVAAVTSQAGTVGAAAAFINVDANPAASAPPSLAYQLNQVVAELANAVNTQHEKGYALSPQTNTWQSGGAFFVASGGGPITAADIAVNPAIVQNVQNIAAGATPAPGDGANAQAISDLSQAPQGPLAEYAAFVAQLGEQVNLSGDLGDTAKALLTQIENQRQAAAGVSINEEMTQVVQAQAMYMAAAKVSAAADRMLQSLIASIQ